MTIVEKVAYLKGLFDGMNLDERKQETKLFRSVLDILEDMALTVNDLEDDVAVVSEQVDAVDEDLDELESIIYEDDAEHYGDEEDLDLDFDYDDEDYYEVECPSCNEIICIDDGVLEDGGIDCPNCGESLEFEVDEEEEEETADKI
jgi:formylmethanofuran dehydrogenase subunit E